MTFYALRYVDGTPLSDRKHEHTLGRFPTWLDAEDARESRPKTVADKLEVVVRGAE